MNILCVYRKTRISNAKGLSGFIEHLDNVRTTTSLMRDSPSAYVKFNVSARLPSKGKKVVAGSFVKGWLHYVVTNVLVDMYLLLCTRLGHRVCAAAKARMRLAAKIGYRATDDSGKATNRQVDGKWTDDCTRCAVC